jgi:hypothetical protein
MNAEEANAVLRSENEELATRNADLAAALEAAEQARAAAEERARTEAEARAEAERRARLDSETPSQRLPSATPAPSSFTPAAAPAPYVKEPKIGEPPTFDGKPAEFHSFLHHCRLYLEMRFQTFTTDRTKVAYVLSRLRGGPSEWGQALIESHSPLLHDYEGFLDKLSSIYENKERKVQLGAKLARMTQTGSASAFAADFTAVCDILKINEESRLALFPLKLKEGVQKALALLPADKTFDELVDRAIRIDNSQFSHKSNENRQRNQQPKSSESRPSGNSQQRSSASGSGSGKAPPSSSSSSPRQSEPRPSLTQEEKDRRLQDGLCLYCGEKGHFKKACKKWLAAQARKTKNSTPNSQNPSVSQVIIPPYSPPPFESASGKSPA